MRRVISMKQFNRSSQQSSRQNRDSQRNTFKGFSKVDLQSHNNPQMIDMYKIPKTFQIPSNAFQTHRQSQKHSELAHCQSQNDLNRYKSQNSSHENNWIMSTPQGSNKYRPSMQVIREQRKQSNFQQLSFQQQNDVPIIYEKPIDYALSIQRGFAEMTKLKRNHFGFKVDSTTSKSAISIKNCITQQRKCDDQLQNQHQMFSIFEQKDQHLFLRNKNQRQNEGLLKLINRISTPVTEISQSQLSQQVSSMCKVLFQKSNSRGQTINLLSDEIYDSVSVQKKLSRARSEIDIQPKHQTLNDFELLNKEAKFSRKVSKCDTNKQSQLLQNQLRNIIGRIPSIQSLDTLGSYKTFPQQIPEKTKLSLKNGKKDSHFPEKTKNRIQNIQVSNRSLNQCNLLKKLCCFNKYYEPTKKYLKIKDNTLQFSNIDKNHQIKHFKKKTARWT